MQLAPFQFLNTIRPLLELTRLRSFRFSVIIAPEIDDEDFRTMAEAWPCLQFLSLGGSREYGGHTHRASEDRLPTLRALTIISQDWWWLQEVNIPMSIRAAHLEMPAHDVTSRSELRVVSTNGIHPNVQEYPSARQLAEYLDALFPTLQGALNQIDTHPSWPQGQSVLHELEGMKPGRLAQLALSPIIA